MNQMRRLSIEGEELLRSRPSQPEQFLAMELPVTPLGPIETAAPIVIGREIEASSLSAFVEGKIMKDKKKEKKDKEKDKEMDKDKKKDMKDKKKDKKDKKKEKHEKKHKKISKKKESSEVKEETHKSNKKGKELGEETHKSSKEKKRKEGKKDQQQEEEIKSIDRDAGGVGSSKLVSKKEFKSQQKEGTPTPKKRRHSQRIEKKEVKNLIDLL
jgi:hypothetical protein